MPEPIRLETEIGVVGGGPAGATIALRLARLGYRVTLVERSTVPRPQVGNSLPPSILNLLDLVGVRAAVENAGFLRPRRTLIRWSTPEVAIRNETGEAGFLVDRPLFDRLLLEAARAAGVIVLQPAVAEAPGREASGNWLVPLLTPTGRFDLSAAFLIAAGGRRALLPGQLIRYSVPTTALYACWRQEGQVLEEPRLEAGPDHWLWAAPLAGRLAVAMVFLDRARWRATAASRPGLERLYRSLLADSQLVRDYFTGPLISGVRACSSSIYLDSDVLGPRYIKVGESAFALDPIASQGLQMAMVSAYQGAAVVHTILTRPDRAEAATVFYRTRLQETITRHRNLAAQVYAAQAVYPTSPFWRTRGDGAQAAGEPSLPGRFLPIPLPTPARQVRPSPEARLVPIPVLHGDLIEMREAIVHPGLDRPVAFLDGVPLDGLLHQMDDSVTVDGLIQRWSRQVPLPLAQRILNWMWKSGILVAA